MKQTGLFTLALLALASCAKDKSPLETETRQELRLASGIEVMTRGDVQSTEIAEGETVYAWITDAVSEQPLYKATALTARKDGGLSGPTMYFPQTGNAVHIRALHGTFAEGAVTAEETPFPTEGIGFRVEADQHAGGDAYVKSDLLYAVRSDVARTKNTVSLMFYHMLSKFELRIVKGAGVTDDITAVTLNDVALSGTFTANRETELASLSARSEMIAADPAHSGDMLLGTTADDGSGLTNDAIVVPQSVGGKTLTFKLRNGGEMTYTFPEGKRFESGKRHLYEVTLTLTGLNVDSSISPWDTSEEVEKGEATLPATASIGDYYYSDGTFSTELAPEKTVIGIVFQTNPDRIGEAEKEALRLKGITQPHGLVVSVKKVSNGSKWHMDKKYAATDGYCVTRVDCENDIHGLRNYNAIVAYAEKEQKLFMYQAFDEVKNFGVPAPEQTTGWYLPAAGQWYDILSNLGGLSGWANAGDGANYFGWTDVAADVAAKLNARMTPLGEENYDAFRNDSDQWFWTSSTHSQQGIAWRWGLLYRDVRCCYDNQDYSCIVRAVLAF